MSYNTTPPTNNYTISIVSAIQSGPHHAVMRGFWEAAEKQKNIIEGVSHCCHSISPGKLNLLLAEVVHKKPDAIVTIGSVASNSYRKIQLKQKITLPHIAVGTGDTQARLTATHNTHAPSISIEMQQSSMRPFARLIRRAKPHVKSILLMNHPQLYNGQVKQYTQEIVNELSSTPQLFLEPVQSGSDGVRVALNYARRNTVDTIIFPEGCVTATYIDRLCEVANTYNITLCAGGLEATQKYQAALSYGANFEYLGEKAYHCLYEHFIKHKPLTELSQHILSSNRYYVAHSSDKVLKQQNLDPTIARGAVDLLNATEESRNNLGSYY